MSFSSKREDIVLPWAFQLNSVWSSRNLTFRRPYTKDKFSVLNIFRVVFL